MTKREAQHIMNGMFTYLKKYDEVTFDVSLLGTDIEHFPAYFEKHGYITKEIPILDMFKELFLEIINTHKRKLYDEVDTDFGDFHFVTFYVYQGKKVIGMEHFIEEMRYDDQETKKIRIPDFILEVMDETNCNEFSFNYDGLYGEFNIDPYSLESDSYKLLLGDIEKDKEIYKSYVKNYFPFALTDMGSVGSFMVKNNIVKITCNYREPYWKTTDNIVTYRPDSFND